MDIFWFRVWSNVCYGIFESELSEENKLQIANKCQQAKETFKK